MIGETKARQQVLAKITEITGEEAPKDTDMLQRDLCIDSLDKVELVMYLERDLNIQVTDDEIHSFKTVADVINCVSKKEEWIPR